MKLLMITRKINSNDALAGFAYQWVKKIGENLETLYVISWQAGDSPRRTGLPDNIRVIFLPENKILKIFAFQGALIRCLPKVDGVFCHMNPEYTILAAPLAKIFRKKMVSWYTHKAVTWRRRLMEMLTDKIITASALSFRAPRYPDKVVVIGHGIDTDLFAPKPVESKATFDIISVGRISPTKDYESIIKALGEINDPTTRLKIIGDVILPVQQNYLAALKKLVGALGLTGRVEFLGWVANRDLPQYYQNADLFINMSGTGSIDKVVLEAMSCGCLILTSNEAFAEMLGPEFMTPANQPVALADKISRLRNLPTTDREAISKKFRQLVIDRHRLDQLAQKIINQFA